MVYLDNSATSRKKPFCVVLHTLKSLVKSANPGRSGHFDSQQCALNVERCRDLIRKTYFNGNVAFTKNCTEALNLAIYGCDLNKQVITTVYEHNSVLRPLHDLEKKGKITLKTLTPTNGDFTAPLREALRTPTSMLAISAMSNVSGQTTDAPTLAAIAKARDKRILTLVDFAQGAGHLRLDFTDVDMIAVSGHKGLHSPQGIGFLLSKDGVKIKPLILGGTGTSGMSLDAPRELPEALEAGTLNTVGIDGLYYGLKWTERNFSKINGKISALTDYAKECLSSIENLDLIAANNGVVLLNVNGLSSSMVADLLNGEYGIEVRSGLHCAPLMHKYLGNEDGAVRISIGANNTMHDVTRLQKALKGICNK